jgi:YD repeat-containing protein
LSWTYDGVGNRLTETLGATVDTTNYPATSNKPTNITRAGSTVRNWTYDGAGNIATDVRAADSYAYTYSKANRLASVTDLGSPWASYLYNGLDQLASRTVTAPGGPAGTIHYIYDLDGHLIAEADYGSGQTLREYIWLGDLPIALVANVSTTPVLLMVHADHLKRPIRMTDPSKATVWQAMWKPFGEPWPLRHPIARRPLPRPVVPDRDRPRLQLAPPLRRDDGAIYAARSARLPRWAQPIYVCGKQPSDEDGHPWLNDSRRRFTSFIKAY